MRITRFLETTKFSHTFENQYSKKNTILRRIFWNALTWILSCNEGELLWGDTSVEFPFESTSSKTSLILMPYSNSSRASFELKGSSVKFIRTSLNDVDLSVSMLLRQSAGNENEPWNKQQLFILSWIPYWVIFPWLPTHYLLPVFG